MPSVYPAPKVCTRLISLSTMIGCPLEMMSERPRAMVIMARVMTKAGSRT